VAGSVLIVDDDEDVSALVAEVLTEEGFDVTALADARPAAIWEMVGRVEPDVMLLDGGDAAGYGESWDSAAKLNERSRPIAVIMFTAHAREFAEAELGETLRSQKAAFVGFISKPFNLDVLVDVVRRAVEEPRVVRELLASRRQVLGNAGGQSN
jgi:two-component system, NtrC family, nitrogen regulation response regulator NtrX